MLQRNGAALNPEQLELIQAVFCIARYLEEEGFLGGVFTVHDYAHDRKTI